MPQCPRIALNMSRDVSHTRSSSDPGSTSSNRSLRRMSDILPDAVPPPPAPGSTSLSRWSPLNTISSLSMAQTPLPPRPEVTQAFYPEEQQLPQLDQTTQSWLFANPLGTPQMAAQAQTFIEVRRARSRSGSMTRYHPYSQAESSSSSATQPSSSRNQGHRSIASTAHELPVTYPLNSNPVIAASGAPAFTDPPLPTSSAHIQTPPNALSLYSSTSALTSSDDRGSLIEQADSLEEASTEGNKE